jgi:O-glycosyl hydrolase
MRIWTFSGVWLKVTWMIKLAILAGPASLLLGWTVRLAADSGPAEGIQIHINPQEQFQSIDGFGVNVIGSWFRDDQRPMFDMLINDLGATMFRVDPYHDLSDWEKINMHDVARSLPEGSVWATIHPEAGSGFTAAAEEAAKSIFPNWEYWGRIYSSPTFERSWALMAYLNSRGIRPLIALFGPIPEWMTDDEVGPLAKAVSLNELIMKRQNHLSPKMYDAFAEEVVSMLAYARSRAHVDFTYFSPFDETEEYPTEGPRIDPEEVPNVLNAVTRQLKEDGLADVKLAVADQANPADNFFSPILKHPDLMKQVGAFTLHVYGDTGVAHNLEYIKSSNYAQTPLWVTEYGDLNDLDRTAGNEWKGFSIAAQRRGLEALNEGASALVFFDAFDDYEDAVQRLCYYGLFQSAGQVYAPKKRYYAAKQLYHFVLPGARRIAATSSASGLTVSAFFNGAANSLTVVGVKQGGPSHIQVMLPEDAQAPKKWDLYETTPALDCQKVDTIAVKNGVVVFEAPDEVIFTLVGNPN